MIDIEACKAALSDPDTLIYDQVLLDPDIEEWKESAHKEITKLERKDTWVEVPTSEATSRFLQAHGCFVTNESYRTHHQVQARYCVRGDLQENIPETYMSQTQEKPLWSLSCTQALVSISTKRID